MQCASNRFYEILVIYVVHHCIIYYIPQKALYGNSQTIFNKKTAFAGGFGLVYFGKII